jgi:hypothetical protein
MPYPLNIPPLPNSAVGRGQAVSSWVFGGGTVQIQTTASTFGDASCPERMVPHFQSEPQPSQNRVALIRHLYCLEIQPFRLFKSYTLSLGSFLHSLQELRYSLYATCKSVWPSHLATLPQLSLIFQKSSNGSTGLYPLFSSDISI